ncbi:MAG: ATP synthase F1 subunit epsilon [Acidaminococcus sp.]|jgi:F-type H+-transporting ATPase subunit epsilon|nr:ATP synthase F1 subunit epsilon [Acidaminococcus sp.]MCI2099895.1 ATP synthase F1 subunit epsilon [Acidaminococcus sp.]MCI2114126.1 ATP synthase F1 subunit epsilon [Acidaminococcus sp.]MCI2116066.1 ATP synthase F1 subunit epsilon [Acidaminococcus sp.]
MAKLMSLEVLTPDRYLVQRKDISYVLLNTVTGGVGILANHGPMVAVLSEGTLKLQDKDNHVILVYVEGGFAEVKDNKVVILTPRAQKAENIDVAKYEGIRDEALRRLEHPDALTDIEHTEKVLRRAQARLKTASLLNKVEPFQIP